MSTSNLFALTKRFTAFKGAFALTVFCLLLASSGVRAQVPATIKATGVQWVENQSFYSDGKGGGYIGFYNLINTTDTSEFGAHLAPPTIFPVRGYSIAHLNAAGVETGVISILGIDSLTTNPMLGIYELSNANRLVVWVSNVAQGSVTLAGQAYSTPRGVFGFEIDTLGAVVNFETLLSFSFSNLYLNPILASAYDKVGHKIIIGGESASGSISYTLNAPGSPTTSFGSNVLFAVDENFSYLWHNTAVFSDFNLGNNMWDRYLKLLPSPSGDVYACYTMGISHPILPYLIDQGISVQKFDGNGNQLWNKLIGDTAHRNYATHFPITCAANGDLYAAYVPFLIPLSFAGEQIGTYYSQIPAVLRWDSALNEVDAYSAYQLTGLQPRHIYAPANNGKLFVSAYNVNPIGNHDQYKSFFVNRNTLVPSSRIRSSGALFACDQLSPGNNTFNYFMSDSDGYPSYSSTINVSNAYINSYPAAGASNGILGWGTFQTVNFPKVTGNAFIDYNNDGIENGFDYRLPNVLLRLDTLNAISSLYGEYEFDIDTGTYTFSVDSLNNNFGAPAPQTLALPQYGTIDTINVPITVVNNILDMKVNIVALTPSRPGFLNKMMIQVSNIGTTPFLGDTLTLVIDSNVYYHSANDTVDSKIGNVLKWFIPPFTPNLTYQNEVRVFVSSAVNVGNVLSHTAVLPVSGDADTTNNHAESNPIVTGSYDPNDKACNVNSLTPSEVAAGKPLTYVVRFQNTGNDTAFTVVIRDTMSHLVDPETFRMIASSHPVLVNAASASISDPAKSAFAFTFNNILLPDSNTNEPLSHGFIAYEITPRPSTALGDVIENTAAIYFDFNAPIITNTTQTPVAEKLGLGRELSISAGLRLFPNPATDRLTVQLTDNQPLNKATFTVYDLAGRPVNVSITPTAYGAELNVNNLAAGIYRLVVQTDKGMKATGFVVGK